MEVTEVAEYFIDMDSPHSLGERGEGDDFKNTKWLTTDGIYSSSKNSEIVDKMKSGIYSVFQDSNGRTHAQKVEVKSDELYFLPNDKTQDVVREIADFWTKADKFKEAKVKHKRGILFMGPPGTGKTSMINLLTSSLIENDGLVFIISTAPQLYWFIEFVHSHLREIEPDRPVITVIEDIDRFMDGSNTESTLLNLLDGADSFDHNVTIATSNRFDDLNDLLLRPSRFDRQVEVDFPSLAVREAFLIKKGLDDKDAKKWAKDTDQYSIAELKELFISVKLLDMSYIDAKDTIKRQGEAVTKKTYSRKPAKIGF